MADTTQKKRTMSITLNFKNGNVLTLNGSDAQRALQAFRRVSVGDGNATGLTFTNDEGKQQFIFFHCLCGYTLNETTEEEIEGRECDPMDCPTPSLP